MSQPETPICDDDTMRISILVAMTPQRVIGRDGGLPWHLPADLGRFKRLTMGHHVIMGRRTYASLGRPLPGRTIIMLTRQPRSDLGEVHQVVDLDQAIAVPESDSEVFIAGGSEVYRLAMSRVDRIYRTIVHADLPGDTFFPELVTEQWKLVEEEHREADHRNEYAMTFEVLERHRNET